MKIKRAGDVDVVGGDNVDINGGSNDDGGRIGPTDKLR